MWQRFTERSRRVVFFAQEEAARLGENYVGTEHLLLGLIRENDSVAARILDRLGVPLGRIRSDIERQVTRGHGNVGQEIQITPHASRAIDLAYEEARPPNHNLEITAESVDDVPVIRAVGELEIATVPKMRAVVAEVSKRRPRALVFDFRKISYMDSSGLGILVSAKKRLGVDRGEVVLITAQPAVLKALSLSGLDQIIRIYSTEEEYFGVGVAAR